MEKLKSELRKSSPKTTLSWELYYKRKTVKWAIFGTILIITLSTWGFLHNRNLNKYSEMIYVSVSNKYIEKGIQINEKDVDLKPFRRDQLPKGYLSYPSKIIGLFTQQNIPENAIFTESYLKKILNNKSLAFELDKDSVAFTIDGDWLESTMPKITKGDLVSIIVSNPNRSIEDTVFLIKNAEVIDVLQEQKNLSSSFVTLKITEEDSKNLLYARANELLFSIILNQ